MVEREALGGDVGWRRAETLLQCVLEGYFEEGVGSVGGRVIKEVGKVRRRLRCWVGSRVAEGWRARLVTIVETLLIILCLGPVKLIDVDYNRLIVIEKGWMNLIKGMIVCIYGWMDG